MSWVILARSKRPAQRERGWELEAAGVAVLAVGWVLALSNGQVVYAYDKDPRGGSSACTGSCAQVWLPVTGSPVVSPADTGLGTLGTVATSNGAKQITYNGSPLYTYKGAKALATKGNGIGGVWHVVKMSESNIVGGAN